MNLLPALAFSLKGVSYAYMLGDMVPADVADAFVKQYYLILNKCPENVHKFYQEPSLLGWPGPDGVVKPVTTLSGINNKVMSSDYKYNSAEIKTTDAQESLEGGIIVAITGCLTGKDNVKKNFTQTFFLAKQERGFFILNDILQFFDVCESITNAAASSDDENDQPAPAQNSDTNAGVENGKVEEPLALSVFKDTLSNVIASTPSVTSVGRVVAPTMNAKEQSNVAVATSEKMPSVVAPAKNTKLSSVAQSKNVKVPLVIARATNANLAPIAPASNVSHKMTYASMLAKETSVTSPRRDTMAFPTTKASAADDSSKISTPSSGVSKALTTTKKAAPKSPTRSQGKGIYIGGLPYDITKQGIVDVVKKFGAVKRYSDTVQIRRHEDGFCCGFVEFESADAAHYAVEAHRVMFGDKEAYITYKRSSYNRGKNGGARSPTKVGNQNGNVSGRENNDWSYYRKGQARGPRRSSSSDQPLSHQSNPVEIA